MTTSLRTWPPPAQYPRRRYPAALHDRWFVNRSRLPLLAGLLMLVVIAGLVLRLALASRTDVVIARAGEEQTKTWNVEMASLPGRIDLLYVGDLSGSYKDDLPYVKKLLP